MKFVLSFSFFRLLDQPDKARYELADVRCETGRREEESQQDANQRMQQAQAGIPAQDKHHNGQDEQHRQGYGQEITSFLFPGTAIAAWLI